MFQLAQLTFTLDFSIPLYITCPGTSKLCMFNLNHGQSITIPLYNVNIILHLLQLTQCVMLPVQVPQCLAAPQSTASCPGCTRISACQGLRRWGQAIKTTLLGHKQLVSVPAISFTVYVYMCYLCKYLKQMITFFVCLLLLFSCSYGTSIVASCNASNCMMFCSHCKAFSYIVSIHSSTYAWPTWHCTFIHG